MDLFWQRRKTMLHYPIPVPQLLSAHLKTIANRERGRFYKIKIEARFALGAQITLPPYFDSYKNIEKGLG